MDRNEIFVMANSALQYADTISGSLMSISDGALVHEVNRHLGNVEFLTRALKDAIKRHDELDPESQPAWKLRDDIIAYSRKIFSQCDQAVGWMVRTAAVNHG
jgi:hypothetical protein